MKRHFKLSFVLKLLILLIILLGLFIIQNQNDQNAIDKTVNTYTPIPKYTNQNQTPVFNTPNNGDENNQETPISVSKPNKKFETPLEKKEPTPVSPNTDVPKEKPIVTPKPKGLKYVPENSCYQFDYAKLIDEYALSNDFTYILQLYCENNLKSSSLAYELIKDVYSQIENTSYITNKKLVSSQIEKYKNQWDEIVSK
jgi:hypothetical protein